MEDALEESRFTARYNLAESGSRPATVAELLLGAGLTSDEVARGFLETTLRDSPNWGREDLRARVAALHPGSAIDHVLITTGTSEALFLLFRALRPRTTALAWPAFQLLYEVPASLGSAIVRLPVRWTAAGAPFFELAEWLAILERERPDCVVLNFPHNPSGLMPQAEVLDALVERALAIGAVVIGDEHYRFLASDTAALGPTVFRPSPRVFVTGSYIKCLGCPGLRIGWCVGAGTDVLGAMQSEKNYVTHTVNPITEWISLELLRDVTAPVWAEHRRMWRENRQALASALVRSSALHGAAPEGGLVTCVGLEGARSRHEADERLAAIKQAGIAVLALELMELGRDAGASHPAHPEPSAIERGWGFRMGLGAEPSLFRRALATLERVCADPPVARAAGPQDLPQDLPPDPPGGLHDRR
ncbi:MAG TPA: pyridoxal phosphate-dependent aminotransferase [Kofleriaceae bacterium]|nr:pyridoxal phosphate-dependent aminotransferase [Kofleriaceae bacterium]